MHPLGCYGRKAHDPVRLAAVAVVKPHVMAATEPLPLILLRPKILTKPLLVLNNILPTCTVAGLINSANAKAEMNGWDFVVDQQKLLAFYGLVYGCDPTPEAISKTDGLVMLDVLEYAQKHGFYINNTSGPLVPNFSVIDTSNPIGLKDAIFAHGTAYVGVDLYTADEQPDADYTGGLETAGDPVGGHCLDPKQWSATGYTDATWGQEIETDNDWIDSRMVEAYAIDWTFSS